MAKSAKRQFILHPVLFASFPIFFLFSHNRSESLVFEQVLAPLFVCLAASLLLWGLLNLIYKNPRKSALVTSLAVLLFFSFGHLHSTLVGKTLVGLRLWHYRYLFGGYAIALLVAVFWTARTSRKLDKLTAVLNLVSVALVGISLAGIVVQTAGSGITIRIPGEAAEEGFNAVETREDYPDIYYIILDAYANSHTLRERYDYDNSDFISFLEERGFYVAGKSCSNYAFSSPSLASSLNFEYLDYLRGTGGDSPNITVALVHLIENNRTVRFLKRRGYKFVHFDSGWSGNERNRHADLQLRYGYSNEFVVILAQTTLLLPIRKGLNLLAADHRTRILGIFSGLAEVHRTVPGPKFVFAHLVCPHVPYVFGPRGEEREVKKISLTKWGRRSAYTDQVQFVNMKVRELLEVLLSSPEKPPIIVIQADHGPMPSGGFVAEPSDQFLQERMRILNTYYLPGREGGMLYPKITPVNTFRLIFNLYFGQELPLLPDRNYYKGLSTSYDFIDVTERVAFPPDGV